MYIVCILFRFDVVSYMILYSMIIVLIASQRLKWVKNSKLQNMEK